MRMGIASTSFLGAALGRRSSPAAGGSMSQARQVMDLPPVPKISGAADGTTIAFIEHCHGMGAAGVQTQIIGDPHRLRERAEELGMWVEAMISVRNNTTESLEQSIVQAKEAGCTTARDGFLGGRRYESFHSRDEWNAWAADSLEKLTAALPIFEKHKFALALENHKDWTVDEFVALFKEYSSEYLGACLDFGNNIALLDEPMETIAAVAPYVKSTHVKDVAVAAYPDGFLLSEVPLGTGLLDLPQAITSVLAACPGVHLSLEMITRDPLRVPCQLDRYWVTFPERRDRFLVPALRFIDAHRSQTHLPHPEELSQEEHAHAEAENIRTCFRYAEQFRAA